jgi:hypothetical protein
MGTFQVKAAMQHLEHTKNNRNNSSLQRETPVSSSLLLQRTESEHVLLLQGE